MKSWLDDHLQLDFIQPSHSLYAAPCFFISKKSGELRLYIDYRKLNAITVKTRYPLPRINEITIKVSTGQYFTALDLHGAYKRLRVRPIDVPKTAFITNYGLFEFKVMPFGPIDAVGYFQSFMNSLLGHLPFVVVYLDDILIFSPDHALHKKHVATVLGIFLKNEVYCKLSKCQFFQQSITYLGYVISTSGISMAPSKLESIFTWPAPTTRKELESFLGFTNFYRQFIPHSADLTLPFSALISDGTSFSWTNTTQAAFLSFKSSFAHAIALHHPDDCLPYEVECDCSDFALGAVLSQRSPF